MKILFFGNADFGIPTLDCLHKSSFNLISVITNKDKRSGRGKKYSPTPIKAFSLENNIDLIEIEDLKDSEFQKKIRLLEPDLIIVIAYKILPADIFKIPKYGAINLHASLLPNYRGAAPIQRAILNGDKYTGISTFQIDEKVDTGNLILQEEILIDELDDFGELYTKLSEKGPDLIMKSINHIISGKPLGKQKGKISYAKKIKKNEFQINWNLNSIDILNKIRAFSPIPGAFSYIFNKRIKLLKGKKIELEKIISPGEILLGDRFIVGTLTEAIEILELQQEGKRKMSAVEFINGLSIKNLKSLKFEFKE
tara:strand:+ start:1397 stop:2326 length:930 start_codon:yes stop_codon:yes gene_type:complete